MDQDHQKSMTSNSQQTSSSSCGRLGGRQPARQLTPDEIDDLLARVLLVFAKRGQELDRLHGTKQLQNDTPSSDERIATATTPEQ